MSRRKETKICISPAVPLLLAVFALLCSPLLLCALLGAAIIHECGHYALLRRFGAGVSHLSVTVFGAEMRVDDAARLSYGREMLAVAAGPAINLLLALALGAVGRWWDGAYLFAGTNLVLGIFNLLPARPLDGGRLLWIAVAWISEPFTADRITAWVSLILSLLLLTGGIWVLWRWGSSPFLLLGAVGLAVGNLREMGLVKRAGKG